jgi:hypothetical protein
MGLFGGKKTESLTAQELIELRGKAKGLSAKEMKELVDKRDGKVKKSGDIRAGISDLKNGRKGSQGVGKLPARPEGKGRSMWGKDTPLK